MCNCMVVMEFLVQTCPCSYNILGSQVHVVNLVPSFYNGHDIACILVSTTELVRM